MEKTNVNNNSLDKQYQDLLQDILDNGTQKGDRTGTGTISVFGRQIRHNMKDGFPLITSKKMPFKTIATELIWFLKGDTNIKFLVDNGCNIWNGDAYKNYVTTLRNEKLAKEKKAREQGFNLCLEYHYLTSAEFVENIKTDDAFAKEWGDLGPVYGKQWRRWKTGEKRFKWRDLTEEEQQSLDEETINNMHLDVAVYDREFFIDQIANLVKDLRENPDSRRLMVNAWNVAEIDKMVLPPCHYGFQLYTRELSLDERKLYSPDPSLFEDINGGNWSSIMGLEALSSEDKIWLHEQFDQTQIPKRAISLMWNQRSVDTFLGLPFNIASYGLLLEILAKEVNMVPDELIGNLGDTHLYSNHIEQAKEQIGREYTEDERIAMFLETGMDAVADKEKRTAFFDAIPRKTREGYDLPKVEITDSWKFSSSSPIFADNLKLDMFKLVGYRSHDNIKAPLSN